jgi:hypothetical protein
VGAAAAVCGCVARDCHLIHRFATSFATIRHHSPPPPTTTPPVSTSKKLYFDCSLHSATDALVRRVPSTAQGWLLKKGNRAMQGYSKRWVHVSHDGILSYFKDSEG